MANLEYTPTAGQWKRLIIEPVLKSMGGNFNSDNAVNLLLGTLAAESRFQFLEQEPLGPALGFYQIEPATARDIIKRRMPELGNLTDEQLKSKLVTDIELQTKLARYKYADSHSALPDFNDVVAMSKYWKSNYADGQPSAEQEVSFQLAWYRLVAAAGTVVPGPGTLPTISSFSPTSGKEDTIVTLNGTNFIGTSQVMFGNQQAKSFIVNSDTQLHAVAPNGVTTGVLSVANASGTGRSTEQFVVGTVPPPTAGAPVITGFFPVNGPDRTNVLITGTGFTDANKVEFNNTSAVDYAVENDNKLYATVLPSVTTGKIRITTPKGSGESQLDFTFGGSGAPGAPGTPNTQPPTVTSFTPVSGIPGSIVQIDGSNLSGVTYVAFNGTTAPNFTITSDNRIRATVPPNAAGTGPILMRNANGASTSQASYTVTAV